LGKVSKEGLFSIDIAIQNRSIEDLKKASDILLLSGKETSLLIEDLAEHFRNHLLALQKSLDPRFYHLSPKETQSYQELSQGYTQASLLEMLELIYPFFHQPTRPFLSQQQFETLLILLMKKNHRPSLSLIVERLEALEKKLERRILPSAAAVESAVEQVEALASKGAPVESAIEQVEALAIKGAPIEATLEQVKALASKGAPVESAVEQVEALASKGTSIEATLEQVEALASKGAPVESAVEQVEALAIKGTSIEATLEQVEALASKGAPVEATPVKPLEKGMKTDERGSKEPKAEHPSSHRTEPPLSFSPSVSEITAPLKSSDASGDPPLKLLPASVRHQNLIQFAIVEWNAILQ
jgi:DNA polymerase III gamma/tau subunit